jgi:hypothetical protein
VSAVRKPCPSDALLILPSGVEGSCFHLIVTEAASSPAGLQTDDGVDLSHVQVEAALPQRHTQPLRVRRILGRWQRQ